MVSKGGEEIADPPGRDLLVSEAHTFADLAGATFADLAGATCHSWTGAHAHEPR